MADRFGYQNTPKSYAISSPFSGQKWNTATGNPIQEEPSGETNPRPDNLVGKNINPTSGNVTDFGTSDFDPSDKNQVLQLQKSLGVAEDGMFGPKTEAAYRNMVNERRSAEGKDIYHYDDARRTEQPIQSQIPPDENPVFNPMDGKEPDPIGEGYTAPVENQNEQPIMMRNNQDQKGSYWSGEQGLVPDSMQDYVKDTTGSLWGMLKGMVGR